MSVQVMLAALALLVLLLDSRLVEARVRLNSIRTVILRDSHVLPFNRSIWEPSLDFTMYQCMSDLECREGSYCHSSTKGPAHSRCHTCRRRKRHCLRDGMCCPGNHCSKNVCVPNMDTFASQRILDSDRSSKKSWRKRGRVDMKGPAGKGQVGDPCLRSSDCSDGLCCARHFWGRICKPVLQEGQVCTQQRRKGSHGLELFQRCPCGDRLNCRTLREARGQPAASSSSSSSLLAAAAANSKLSSSSARHSLPHKSLLSSSKASSSSTVAKTRLHVCQRENVKS